MGFSVYDLFISCILFLMTSGDERLAVDLGVALAHGESILARCSRDFNIPRMMRPPLDLCTFPAGSSLYFLDVDYCYSPNSESFQPLFLQIFFFSTTPIIHILLWLGVPYISPWVCLLFFSFLFLSFLQVTSSLLVFKFIDTFFCWLKSRVETLHYCACTSRTSTWFFSLFLPLTNSRCFMFIKCLLLSVSTRFPVFFGHICHHVFKVLSAKQCLAPRKSPSATPQGCSSSLRAV